MTETTETTPPKKAKKRLAGKTLLILSVVLGLLIGVIGTTAYRFSTIKDDTVHYHANFAVYVNGKQDTFENFTFYEEVAACNSKAVDNPKVRTHMHYNKAGLIHVHDGGVTWGQFFENIGYTLGDNTFETRQSVYVNEQNNNDLTFILNGEKIDSVADKLIETEDTLLINYGNDTNETLQERFSKIPNQATEANTKQDPAACSGGHEFNFWTRLKQAIGIPEPDGHGH